jgi:hypothetical protein
MKIPVACCIGAVTSLGYHASSSRVMPDDDCMWWMDIRRAGEPRVDDSVLRGAVDCARRCTLAIKSADEAYSSFRKTDVYHYAQNRRVEELLSSTPTSTLRSVEHQNGEQ